MQDMSITINFLFFSFDDPGPRQVIYHGHKVLYARIHIKITTLKNRSNFPSANFSNPLKTTVIRFVCLMPIRTSTVHRMRCTGSAASFVQLVVCSYSADDIASSRRVMLDGQMPALELKIYFALVVWRISYETQRKFNSCS